MSRHLRAAGGVLLAVAVAGCCLGVLRTRSGVGADRATAGGILPADAADINYYNPGWPNPASYCDFATTPAGFAECVERWGLPWTHRHTGDGRAVRWDHAAGRRAEVEVADGEFVSWTREDAGRFLAFDRRTGRAYCWGHTR